MEENMIRHHHHHGEHHSNRAGHNRRTKSQKLRRIYGNILFGVLSILAALIVLFIIYDHWKGAF